MRFLANENFGAATVQAMRDLGHDVVWVRTDAPGSSDTSVLAWAQRESRVLLTFDKDFGELAYRSRLPASCGIILFRLPLTSAAKLAGAVSTAIGSREDWEGHFSVVEPTRIRMIRLPS
ncbi:MAG TPA: DUF5615 family PIN-like protein [Candidatus Xenobia bacterium]|jgi:predicted nuclease of predicted toxin-antitoxin system